MYFNTDRTSIHENPSDLQLSQASSTATSQRTFVDMIPQSTAISDDYLVHEQTFKFYLQACDVLYRLANSGSSLLYARLESLCSSAEPARDIATPAPDRVSQNLRQLNSYCILVRPKQSRGCALWQPQQSLSQPERYSIKCPFTDRPTDQFPCLCARLQPSPQASAASQARNNLRP